LLLSAPFLTLLPASRNVVYHTPLNKVEWCVKPMVRIRKLTAYRING